MKQREGEVIAEKGKIVMGNEKRFGRGMCVLIKK